MNEKTDTSSREIVPVDERQLQSIIAGSSRNIQPIPVTEPTVQGKPPQTEKNSKGKTGKLPKDTLYKKVFLNKRPIENRRQSSIILNGDMVDRINKILSVVSPGTSFSAFINNLLLNHIEEYKETMNDLFEQDNKTLF